jgi:hypothetical protein
MRGAGASTAGRGRFQGGDLNQATV